jgi:signal transduction histidine kinase
LRPGSLDNLGLSETLRDAVASWQLQQPNVRFSLQLTGELEQLKIKDNGVGISICNVDQSKHFGLLGMRERTQALLGSFSIDSMSEQGTSISVTIPNGRDT